MSPPDRDNKKNVRGTPSLLRIFDAQKEETGQSRQKKPSVQIAGKREASWKERDILFVKGCIKGRKGSHEGIGPGGNLNLEGE